jgi:hypothetical protein
VSEAEVLARLPDALRAIVEGILRLTYWRGFVDGCVASLLFVVAIVVAALIVRRVP